MIRHFDDPLAPATLRDIPHIMQHALLTAGLPNASMQMTYWAVSRFADEDGDAQPLQQQIITMLPDSESTIKRNLKALKALGWLQVTEERWAFDGRRNAYHMTAGSDGFPITPRDPAHKPASIQEALMDALEGTRLELAEERARNTRLEGSMRALASAHEVEVPSSIEGQIDTGQIDPTKKEEEELSGQFDTYIESSSDPLSGLGHSEDRLDGNMTPNQPELQVETIESLEDPWITEMKEWVRENWSQLRYSPTNRDGFRATLPRVITILAGKGEENYRDSRTHWEAVWAEQEAQAAASAASFPASLEPAAEPVPAPDLPEIRISSVDHEAQGVWRQVLADMELKVPAEHFEAYLKRTSGYAWDVSNGQRCLLVAVRGSLAVTWLERRIFNDITRVLEAVAGEGTTVRFEVGELVIEGPEGEGTLQ